MMLHHPEWNPVLWQINEVLAVRWYGIMYLTAFLVTYLGLRRLNPSQASKVLIEDIIFWGAIGVIVGGRLGYMLFYQTPVLLADWRALFKVWQGGMSFHGGLLGVMVAIMLLARKRKLPWLRLTDDIALFVPFGLAAGRFGNFINGEIWGPVTDMPWGMVYPWVGSYPRHPWPLYAMIGEGLILAAWVWSLKPRASFVGQTTAHFLMGYGIIRFIEEFWRMPDPQYGYLLWGWVTAGQLLSIPLIIAGMALWHHQTKQAQPKESLCKLITT